MKITAEHQVGSDTHPSACLAPSYGPGQNTSVWNGGNRKTEKVVRSGEKGEGKRERKREKRGEQMLQGCNSQREVKLSRKAWHDASRLKWSLHGDDSCVSGKKNTIERTQCTAHRCIAQPGRSDGSTPGAKRSVHLGNGWDETSTSCVEEKLWLQWSSGVAKSSNKLSAP